MKLKTVGDLKNYLNDIPNNVKIEFGNWCQYDEYTELYLSNINLKEYESFGPTLEIELEF